MVSQKREKGPRRVTKMKHETLSSGDGRTHELTIAGIPMIAWWARTLQSVCNGLSFLRFYCSERACVSPSTKKSTSPQCRQCTKGLRMLYAYLLCFAGTGGGGSARGRKFEALENGVQT